MGTCLPREGNKKYYCIFNQCYGSGRIRGQIVTGYTIRTRIRSQASQKDPSSFDGLTLNVGTVYPYMDPDSMNPHQLTVYKNKKDLFTNLT